MTHGRTRSEPGSRYFTLILYRLARDPHQVCGCYGNARSATVKCQIDSACLRGYCLYRGYKIPYGRSLVAGCNLCTCEDHLLQLYIHHCCSRCSSSMPFNFHLWVLPNLEDTLFDIQIGCGRMYSSKPMTTVLYWNHNLTLRITISPGTRIGGRSKIMCKTDEHCLQRTAVFASKEPVIKVPSSDFVSTSRSYCLYQGNPVKFYHSILVNKCQTCTCVPRGSVPTFYCHKTAACRAAESETQVVSNREVWV